VAPGSHRVLAIVTDPVEAGEPIEEIRRGAEAGSGVEVRVVVPAVEETAFRHLMGDVDGPAQHAEATLAATLAALRKSGFDARGSVGDADPVLAAADALREQPADEVLIFEHAGEQARWFENGLFERAQESLAPPLRMVVVESHEGAPDQVVEIEEAGPGIAPREEKEIGSAYLPGLTRADFAGIVAGIVGTIVVIVLAAAAAGSGSATGWNAAAIGIAIFTALVNMAHVVGLTLFDSVGYHGGFAKFFRTLSLLGTPAAVLANLLILVLT
jgi:hypothetical protein